MKKRKLPKKKIQKTSGSASSKSIARPTLEETPESGSHEDFAHLLTVFAVTLRPDLFDSADFIHSTIADHLHQFGGLSDLDMTQYAGQFSLGVKPTERARQ